MNRIKLAAAFAVALILPLSASAKPFDPKRVPADAKWVVHVDMDAARTTKTWDSLGSALFGNNDFRQGIDGLEQLTGGKFPDDLHDVTLFGADSGDDAGVVIISAKVDRNRMETAVRQNPAYEAVDYGKYKLLTWEDKGKTMHGAFKDDSTVVVGRDDAKVKSALDTLDGKGETVKADEPLVAGIKAVPEKSSLMLYVALRDFASLQKNNADKQQAAVFKEIDSVWITITEADGSPTIHSELTAKDGETAEKVRQAATGLKAMVSLMGGADKADPVAKAIAKAVTGIKTKTDESTVKIDWPMTIEQLNAIVDGLAAKANGQ